MDKKQILALDSKKHVKIWLLHKLGMSRREIADALGTNPGHVGNEIKSYEKNEDKRKAAEAMGGPTINEEYERQRLINAGMPDVADQRYPIKKIDTAEADYLRAAKIPKGGTVNATDENLQAWSAESIAKRHAMRPSAIFQWANKHKVNLMKTAYILGRPESNKALLEDVFQDKYSATKKLLEKAPIQKYPVYRHESNGQQAVVKYFETHQEAQNWINTEARQSDWYFFTVGNPIEVDKKKDSENDADIKVKVTGIDKVTGSEEWESTIGELKSWDLTASEIEDIKSGKKVKVTSPNGRRTITISLLKEEPKKELETNKEQSKQSVLIPDSIKRKSDIYTKQGEELENEMLDVLKQVDVKRLASCLKRTLDYAIKSKSFVNLERRAGKPAIEILEFVDYNSKKFEKAPQNIPHWEPIGKNKDSDVFFTYSTAVDSTSKGYTIEELEEFIGMNLKTDKGKNEESKKELLELEKLKDEYKKYSSMTNFFSDSGREIRTREEAAKNRKIANEIKAKIEAIENPGKPLTMGDVKTAIEKNNGQMRKLDLDATPIDVLKKMLKEAERLEEEALRKYPKMYSDENGGGPANYYHAISGISDAIERKNQMGKGGILQGPKHGDGGIKAKSPNGPLEVEGGEIIINAKAAKEHCQELSEINQSAGGGVAFPCDHPALDGIQGPMNGKGAEIQKDWNVVYFMVDSDGADQLLHENFKSHVDYHELPNGDVLYVMPRQQYDRFFDLADSTSQEFGASIEEVNENGEPLNDKYSDNYLDEAEIEDKEERIEEGVEVEKEHTDLYNELSQRLDADGHPMPMSKDEFFRMITTAHIKERGDYYPLLKKYVEHAPSLMDKPYYLLTKEEVITCRDFIEMRGAAGMELTVKCHQRLKDLARYSVVKFNTLLSKLK